MLQTELGRIDAVMSALDRKRPDVAAHCRRVSAYSVALATQFGLSHDDIETIRLGGLLHDVGKMLVPSRILTKPGRPNSREWQELKIHPELGMEIAHRSGFDDEVCAIVLYHHERHDGRGYPDGLGERSIHYTARIVSVMDTFDALTSSRDYRERLTPQAARTVVSRGAGTKFCPWVVSAFMALPVEMLLPRGEEGRAAIRYPEGPVFLPPDQLAQPWHFGAETPQYCPC